MIKVKLDISDKDRDNFIENFGDTAVIFNNNFKEKVNEAAQKGHINYLIGDVKFTDYDFISRERLKQFENIDPIQLLWKDNYFKQQREFRIVLLDTSVKDYCYFEIGSIREDAKVHSTKELLTNLYFELPI